MTAQRARAMLVLALLALHSVLVPVSLNAATIDDGQNRSHKAPIFRERDKDNSVSRLRESLPETQPDLEDPAAYLEMAGSSKSWLKVCAQELESGAKKSPHVRANFDYLTAWDKLDQLLQRNGAATKPMALRLGSSGNPDETLGSDFTNYAPDNFSDREIMKLFEINETLRASGSSSANGMKRVNFRMRRAYIQALAGVRPIEACSSRDEQEKCKICDIVVLDASKPRVTYPCGHVYHQNCALTNTAKQRESINMCPQCESYYRVPLVEPEAKV